MSFDRAFELLIGSEGGYVNDPHDPGGETKYGISKRSYPTLDIASRIQQTALETLGPVPFVVLINKL